MSSAGELQRVLRKHSRADGLAATDTTKMPDADLSRESCGRHGRRYTCKMPETEILSPSKRIWGVLAPVVTPFKADLSPDRDRFIRHCRWLLSQNCGLAPFGTTSEANSMSLGK